MSWNKVRIKLSILLRDWSKKGIIREIIVG